MSWQEYLEQAIKTELNCRVFAAFNSNVDVIVQVKAEHLDKMVKMDPGIMDRLPRDPYQVSPIATPEQFIGLLKECLADGKSYYDVVDINLGDWFDQVFTDTKEAMGGQAGIIANQMAALEAEAYVYNPVLSKKQAHIYHPDVRFPKVDEGLSWVPVEEGVNDSWTKFNFIFEYSKGSTYSFGAEKVVTPRANRIILGTRNPKAAMGFDPDIEPYLPELGASVDMGFMAGYHHGCIAERAETIDEFIELSMAQHQAMCSRNPHLKLHYEYVPMKDSEDERKLLTSLVPLFHSFGINENEIRKVLSGFGYEELADEIGRNERAFNIYRGTLTLLRKLKVPRIQLHNLGYYIVLLSKPYHISPEKVRQACLFASAVNAVKAQQGGAVPKADVGRMKDYKLSDIGFEQLQEFTLEAQRSGIDVPADFAQTGILEQEDHTMLLIPAHVIPNPISTVGMGDTVSSSAYAAEISLALHR